MDVLIARTPENAQKILAALKEFGMGSLPLAPADFLQPDKVIQLGYPPVRIDLITSLTGVENEKVFAGRIMGDFYGLKVPIISREHLRTNKRATGRTQDLLDLENLG